VRQEIHGTVWKFDARQRAGALLTDQGQVVQFDRSAFEGSGLRLLRPGQRIRAVIDTDPSTNEPSGVQPSDRVPMAVFVTLATLTT